MKQPSSRKSLPNGTVSCSSTVWYGEVKRSYWRAVRTKKPRASVRNSVIAPGAMYPAGTSSSCRSGIGAAAPDGLVARALRPQHGLQVAEHTLGLGRVVGRE